MTIHFFTHRGKRTRFGARRVFVLFVVALFALGVRSPNPLFAQSPTWIAQTLTARNFHAMAYDSARGITVLFGGSYAYTTNSENAETWEWNGTSWSRRFVDGPSARKIHAMAYDATRGVTVLFGGYNEATGYNNETWEWDGTTWTRRLVTGPYARGGHAMYYDAARGVVVLFGGGTGGVAASSETWEWNGTTWTQRIVSGPSARSGHAMAYDPVRGVGVLFGGRLGGTTLTYSAETWEWNGLSWTQRSVPGPSARQRSAMVYDTNRGVTLLYGGEYGSRDTWEWNGTSWTLHLINPDNPRSGHAMVYDVSRRVAVMFGGWNGGIETGTTLLWNGTTWTESVSYPRSRSGSAMVYQTARNSIFMFGGTDTYTGVVLADAWEWSGSSWTRRAVSGASPPANAGHAMAYDSARGIAVLFGGVYGQVNETWEWNGDAWSRRFTSGPSPRYNHAMAYDSRRGVTVLYGGWDGVVRNNETWEWNGTLWSQRLVAGPAGRTHHAMAFDSTRGVTVLHGGIVGTSYNSETWEWDGTSWTMRSSAGPNAPNFMRNEIVYDAARGVTVLYGKTTNGSSFITAEWNGASWSQHVLSGYTPSYYGIMAYDSFGRTPVLLQISNGGSSSTAVWTLGMPCSLSFTRAPISQSICATQGASFTVESTGSTPVGYQWQWQPANNGVWAALATGINSDAWGTPMVEATNVTGATLSLLPLIGYTSADAKAFRCVITNICGSVPSRSATMYFDLADIGNAGGVPGRDGVRDNNDFVVFINLFFENDPRADVGGPGGLAGGDGMWDNNDFIVFINAFFGGC